MEVASRIPAYAKPGLEVTLPEGWAAKDVEEAFSHVRRYLKDKSWGFFGATCEQWALIHYLWDVSNVYYTNDRSEWVVQLTKKEKTLGPAVVRYYVDAYSGHTYGDKGNHMDSHFAEGCDKF
jgi:hypothetical protein